MDSGAIPAITLCERLSSDPPAFIEPCLPRPASKPPTGRGWIYEIKHDGFRIMARRADGRVRLLTRKGTNFASRFPQIVAAVTVLPVSSCLIEAWRGCPCAPRSVRREAGEDWTRKPNGR